ncbi:MAG: multicopper oxidase domain-containing protein [Methylococcales bacterium]
MPHSTLLFWILAFGLFQIPVVDAVTSLPSSERVTLGAAEPFCNMTGYSDWRNAQVVEGVEIQESEVCSPDNPFEIALFVKGTNNISMDTLMDTNISPDAVVKKDDVDGDGDPDDITIRLEVMELNGRSPDFDGLVPTYDIAPGIQPGFWVFAPKTRDMSTDGFASIQANPTLRVPSPVIRVEQGDTVHLILENAHYMPHSIHLHGVDHPYMDHGGSGNDGVGQTSAMDVMPGEKKTYTFKPRQAGSMYYHCHVQPHVHIPMGLQGLLVVEENRPNNWVQTFNIGAGQVRHPSVAVREKYAREYDLHYQSADKELHRLIQKYNDPRLISWAINQQYDSTDATDDYFMLNGRAFPYTLRESLIVADKNQKIKLRILNGHTEALALHIHGHKPTATHYDGVDNGAPGRITRDVHAMAPAQRLDLELETTDDGLHSFGAGVWMFHDHTEKAFTTDGMGEGGSLSLVVYKNYLQPDGAVSLHGSDLAPFFTKEFWQRGYPVWQELDKNNALGMPEGLVPQPVATKAAYSSNAELRLGMASSGQQGPAVGGGGSWFGQLIAGIVIGLLAYFGVNALQSRKLLPFK